MLSALGLPALRGPSAAFREQKPICQCCIVPSTSGRRVELWRPVDQPPGHRSSVVAQAQRGRPKSKSPPKEKQPSTPSAPGQGKRGRPPKQGGAIAGGAAIAAGMGAASLRPGEEQDFFGPADDDVLAEDAQLLDVLAEGEDEEEDELGDDDDYDGLDDGFDMDDDEEEGEEYDLDDATARAGTSGPEGVPTEEIDYDTLVRQTQLPRGAPAQISIATAEELKRFNVGQDDGASKAVAIPGARVRSSCSMGACSACRCSAAPWCMQPCMGEAWSSRRVPACRVPLAAGLPCTMLGNRGRLGANMAEQG